MPRCWASRTRNPNTTNMPPENRARPAALSAKAGSWTSGVMNSLTCQGLRGEAGGTRDRSVRFPMMSSRRNMKAQRRMAQGNPRIGPIRVTMILKLKTVS